jgi:hypothetical protein
MTDIERHPITDDADAWTLGVTGSVDRPLTLTRDDLSGYSLAPFHEDFDCEAGWTAEGLSWRRTRVGTLLDRAGPAEDAAYVLVRAMDGDYACSSVGRLATRSSASNSTTTRSRPPTVARRGWSRPATTGTAGRISTGSRRSN